MLIRSADSSGDILPVLSSRDLLSGPEAVAQLVQYRLSLLQGEWWEYPEDGFFILEEMRSGRITDADAASLASRITAYIRDTDSVQDVENVRFSTDRRRFSYSCEIRTGEGKKDIVFSAVY